MLPSFSHMRNQSRPQESFRRFEIDNIPLGHLPPPVLALINLAHIQRQLSFGFKNYCIRAYHQFPFTINAVSQLEQKVTNSKDESANKAQQYNLLQFILRSTGYLIREKITKHNELTSYIPLTLLKMILDENNQTEALFRSFNLLKSVKGKSESTHVDFRYSKVISKLVYCLRFNQKKIRVLINHRLKPGEGKCFNFSSGSIIVLSPYRSLEKELNLTILFFHELMHAFIHDIRKRDHTQSLLKWLNNAKLIIDKIDQAPIKSKLRNTYWSGIMAYHYKMNRTEDVLIRMMEKEQFFSENLNAAIGEIEQPYQKQICRLRHFSYFFFRKITGKKPLDFPSEKELQYKTLPAFNIA